ncbi:tail fiber assembly protein [Yersinia aldovae]|uniref:tail fiber assembly protein n=1 Tax=Yersinia aldovae TaxID=29483 RepID=UPI0021BD0D34|nr:tail fiber assembly protein [Yersinia aldovae]
MNTKITAQFSPSVLAFYPQNMIDDDSYGSELPSDLTELTNEELGQYWKQIPPSGKRLGAVAGRPAWVDVPPPTGEELAALAASQKAALIAQASQIISPLRDALDGGYIDDTDKPKLAVWQKYRYDLTKVDPEDPVWPDKPAE